jgi:hypothetical protein
LEGVARVGSDMSGEINIRQPRKSQRRFAGNTIFILIVILISFAILEETFTNREPSFALAMTKEVWKEVLKSSWFLGGYFGA